MSEVLDQLDTALLDQQPALGFPVEDQTGAPAEQQLKDIKFRDNGDRWASVVDTVIVNNTDTRAWDGATLQSVFPTAGYVSAGTLTPTPVSDIDDTTWIRVPLDTASSTTRGAEVDLVNDQITVSTRQVWFVTATVVLTFAALTARTRLLLLRCRVPSTGAVTLSGGAFIAKAVEGGTVSLNMSLPATGTGEGFVLELASANTDSFIGVEVAQSLVTLFSVGPYDD